MLCRGRRACVRCGFRPVTGRFSPSRCSAGFVVHSSRPLVVQSESERAVVAGDATGSGQACARTSGFGRPQIGTEPEPRAPVCKIGKGAFRGTPRPGARRVLVTALSQPPAISSVRAMRRLAAVAMLCLAGALPAWAQASTKTVTVPGTLVFQNQQRPGDPGNCSAVGFVQWVDVPNTVGATAFYTFKGAERSKYAAPPFDDVYKLVATYTVTPGSHWIQVTRNWADGPRANTCEEGRKKLEALVTNPVRVSLSVTIDDAACNVAKTTLAKRQSAVRRLQARVSGAKGEKRARLKRALANAKKSRDKAKQKVTATC